MKTIPEMTKDLESQLTRQIRAFERVAGLKVQNVHCQISGSRHSKTEVSVTLAIDDRPVSDCEFDPLATEDV